MAPTGIEPRAVAVGVLKGGFGKTTTALNTARELSHRNDSALLVDLDDNGHLSLSLGFDAEYSSDVNHAGRVFVDGDDPSDYIRNVADGLDIFPSHAELESVESELKEATLGTTRVKTNLVDELLGSEYEYIVLDCPANRGKLNDNAMFATGNLIIPLRPEAGFESGITNTATRLVKEARQYFDLDILAVVPSDLRHALHEERRDRQLLEYINDPARENIRRRVPNFARLSPEEWDAIDDDYGAWRQSNELPGIRHRAAIDAATDAGEPLRDFAPACDQLRCYEELAEIVERGRVAR